jgi:putative hydrolase of the HAD superfamily
MIKNLIFDFGDVFINLDKTATLHLLGEAGYANFPNKLRSVLEDYEKGLLSTSAFVKEAQQHFPGLSREKIISAWDAIILDFPEHRMNFIKELAQQGKYRLFLFSNTNELHIKKVRERMGLKNYKDFKACFEGFYLSHEYQMRKPDAEAFETILQKHNLKAGETIFIDDTLEHILSAGKLGINTWHLQAGKDDVTELLTHL